MMERSLEVVERQYQAALPWRTAIPLSAKLNNKSMAERHAALLKKTLLGNEDLSSKYKATMDEYIEESINR